MDFLYATLNDSFSPGQHFALPAGSTAVVLSSGMIEFTPSSINDDTTWLLLSAGIHGNETAPIEIANAIIADLFSGTLPLHCKLAVQFANIEAIRQGKRYIQHDMNRLFNSAHQANAATIYEAKRAAELEKLTHAFFTAAPSSLPTKGYHYDMHTAIRGSIYPQFAVCPFQLARSYPFPALATLGHTGIATVLLSRAPSCTYSDYSSRLLGVNAFTLELGKAYPLGQNDLTQFTHFDQALREQISTPHFTPPPINRDCLTVFRAKYDLIKHSEQFVLNVASTTENFTLLPDGFIIAEEQSHRYIAHGGNERIVFPNPHVQPGLRAGIIVEPFSLP